MFWTKAFLSKLLLIIIALTLMIPGRFALAAGNYSIAPSARLYLSVDKESFLNPEFLTVDIIIDPGGGAINATETVLDYPPEIITVENISYSSTSLSLLIHEDINNELGQTSINCGTSSRFFIATSTVARVTFKKIKRGWAKINLNNSKVLAADGFGTNILGPTEIHNLLIIK